MRLIKNLAIFLFFVAIGCGAGVGLFYFQQHQPASGQAAPADQASSKALASQPEATSTYADPSWDLSLSLPAGYLLSKEESDYSGNRQLGLTILHKESGLMVSDTRLGLVVLDQAEASPATVASWRAQARRSLSQGELLQSSQTDPARPGLATYSYAGIAGKLTVYELNSDERTVFLTDRREASQGSSLQPAELLQSLRFGVASPSPAASGGTGISPLLRQ